MLDAGRPAQSDPKEAFLAKVLRLDGIADAASEPRDERGSGNPEMTLQRIRLSRFLALCGHSLRVRRNAGHFQRDRVLWA
jgi:hypothetical protein